MNLVDCYTNSNRFMPFSWGTAALHSFKPIYMYHCNMYAVPTASSLSSSPSPVSPGTIITFEILYFEFQTNHKRGIISFISFFERILFRTLLLLSSLRSLVRLFWFTSIFMQKILTHDYNHDPVLHYEC